MLNVRSYRAQSVTLTSHSSSYSLLTLLQAVDANFPMTGKEVNIQVDSSVAGTVRIGESNVSSTVCGYALSAGDSRVYRSDKSDIPIGMIFVQGSADSMVLNIEVTQ